MKTLNRDIQLCTHISINQLGYNSYLFLSNELFIAV
jgi:hypothetical protein